MSEFNAVQPLAWDSRLNDIAETHGEDVIRNDVQAHTIGSSTFVGRLADAGYDYSLGAENIYAFSDSDPEFTHAAFMIDWGYDAEDYVDGQIRTDFASFGDGMQDPAGHRISIMNGRLSEVGLSAINETNPNTAVGEVVVTQVFGTERGENARLVGVVVDDRDSDNFYDIGEGLADVTVTVSGNGTLSTTTWSSGGYQIELDPGAYIMTFNGGPLNAPVSRNFTIGSENIKEDLFLDADGNSRTDPVTVATAGADAITGTGRNDVKLGLTGDDIIFNSGGSDSIDGGPGTDTFVSLMSKNSATLTFNADGTIRINDRFGNGDVDTLIDIETVRFNEAGQDIVVYDTLGALTEGQWESLIEIYTAYFNRAPDSVGLMFWADKLATGMSLEQIAEFFFDQPETRAAYSDTNNAEVFVSEVYDNVLGRTPDQDGFDFWVSVLDSGFVTEGAFVLEIIRGAKAGTSQEDVDYLAAKTDLGAYFGVGYGIDNRDDALAVFNALGDQATSDLSAAVQVIESSYADALTNGGLLVDMSVYMDEPFAIFT